MAGDGHRGALIHLQTGGMRNRARLIMTAIALVMSLLVGTVAWLQYQQWQQVERSLQTGQNAGTWNHFQVKLEHLRLRKQLDEVLLADSSPQAMASLALRFQIFAGRLDLLSQGNSAKRLVGREQELATLSTLTALVKAHEDYFALGDHALTFDRDRLLRLKQALGESSPAVQALLLASISDHNATTTEQLLVIREQLRIAAASSAVLAALALVFGAMAMHQLRLAHRRLADLRTLHQEVSHRAARDALTQLFNRDEFERRLQIALETCRVEAVEHAVLFIDLDHFKIVNDRCGHIAGDQLLRDIAALLAQPIGNRDTLARLGGDEFGVVLTRCGEADAQTIAEQLCRRVDAYRFSHQGQSFRVGASIGLVRVEARWPSTTAILQAADSACYVAKQAGRNRIHVYRDTDRDVQVFRGQMQWLQRLESALDEQRLELCWQRILPLHAGASGRGVHGEVLLRLREDDTLISPAQFLPVAERYGMVTRIDRWVVTQVFDWLEQHHHQLHDLSALAINLSGYSVGDSDFHRFMFDQLAKRRLPAEKLVIEITETAAITHLSASVAFIEALRQRRVRVALDDFGSGMSSFGYLKSLPVDYLKIDGQFTRNLERDSFDQVTVRAICDVAQASGKQTIAEWVESDTSASMLRDFGVDYGQGFLWHAPEPLDTLLLAMSHSTPTPSSLPRHDLVDQP